MSNTTLVSIIKNLISGEFGWYQAFEAFRAWLPQYEVRFVLFILIIIVLILLNYRWKEKRSTPVDGKVGLSAKQNKNLKKRTEQIIVSTIIRSRLLINIILSGVFVVLFFMTFFIRPSVISTYPELGGYMSTGEGPIEIIFDLPFDKDTIDFNISPDVAGEWVIESVGRFLPSKRKVSFYPSETIYPQKEVIIYVVGIRSNISKGKIHEHALEMHSPVIPDIVSIKPADKEKNVPVDQIIEIEFNAPLGDFVRLDFNFEPDLDYTRKYLKGNTLGLQINEPLAQDETYFLGVLRTPRSYDVNTKEDIEVGESELIRSTTFSTVTTPLIESYSPKGTSVFIDEDIVIIFDQPMRKESVEEHFSITPEINGEFSWEDDKTLHYITTQNFAKDTQYSMKLSAGVLSGESGSIPKDILMEFKTIGRVEVKSNAPTSGSYGLDPSNTNIVLEFNQPVDKESAESNFVITPNVNGTFKWEGNKLIYQTAGKLAYSTKYDVKIKPGVKTVQGLDSIEEYSYSFVTKDNLFSLNVPWYKQQEGFTCNVASTRMALAYRGIYVSEYDVKSGVGIGDDPNQNWVPGYGVHWGPIANYIGQYRNVAVKSGWNIQELAQEVEKGNPVIVWWYNRYSQPYGSYTLPSGATAYMGMHSEVVRGFIGSSSNPTGLMTNDPWRGYLTYTPSLFTSTWSYLGYKAVVVY